MCVCVCEIIFFSGKTTKTSKERETTVFSSFHSFSICHRARKDNCSFRSFFSHKTLPLTPATTFPRTLRAGPAASSCSDRCRCRPCPRRPACRPCCRDPSAARRRRLRRTVRASSDLFPCRRRPDPCEGAAVTACSSDWVSSASEAGARLRAEVI